MPVTLSKSCELIRVRRCEPEFLKPAKPTPRELKQLSDIDDQDGFRFHMSLIQIYRHNPAVKGKDPVKVIREALAQTLVFYYPFAGRLREGGGRKLLVDCTGEGAIFIEADADSTVDQFGGDPICPPFPSSEEFLYAVPGSDRILNSALLLIQVTRLKCGGFIVAVRFNHTMSDATGIAQFLNAIGEMARGAPAPSILPVWERQLLRARDPPRVTCTHDEYNIDLPTTDTTTHPQFEAMATRCFALGVKELSTLRKIAPLHLLPPCTRFELVTACLWRCCTIAFQPESDEVVRIKIAVNARPKLNPPLPKGYYGNVFANPTAQTTARKLLDSPLGYALELIRGAKTKVTEEYMRSTADLMVIKGRPHLLQFENEVGPAFLQIYDVTDTTHVGFDLVDYGWGKAAYGGQAKGWVGDMVGAAAAYLPYKDKSGEPGIMILLSLPAPAMERFTVAFEELLEDNPRSRL